LPATTSLRHRHPAPFNFSTVEKVGHFDLKGKNAQFINPKLFAERVAAADKVVSL
jgi:hypothetical protein